MIRSVTIKVSGQVQGVFFRESARSEARKLGLTGLVRNEADGSVFLAAEGSEEALQKFVDWCRHGPPMAKVTGFETDWSEDLNFYKGFELA